MAEEGVFCRSCGSGIRLRQSSRVGQQVACPKCGTRLEIIGLNPIELDWAFDAPIDESSSDVLADDPAGGPGMLVA